MEKEKYAKLSTNQLMKRKRYTFIILVVLIAAIVIDGSVLIYNLVIGNGLENALIVPVAACVMVLIPIQIGKRNMEEELKKRKES